MEKTPEISNEPTNFNSEPVYLFKNINYTGMKRDDLKKRSAVRVRITEDGQEIPDISWTECKERIDQYKKTMSQSNSKSIQAGFTPKSGIFITPRRSERIKIKRRKSKQQNEAMNSYKRKASPSKTVPKRLKFR